MNRHYLFYGALIVGLGLALFAWLKAHDAYRDAVAENKLLSQYTSQKDKEIQAAHDAEKKALSDLEAARNKPATVHTVTKYLPAPLPNGSEIQIVTPKSIDSQGKIVAEPPVLQLSGDPQANLKAIQGMELDCQECKASLAARNEQYQAAQDKIKALEKERDNWQVAAGKHGFWGNVKEWAIRGGFALGGYEAGRLTHK